MSINWKWWQVDKSESKHPASKCRKAKCATCHPNKYIGGNNKAAVWFKYRIKHKNNETQEG